MGARAAFGARNILDGTSPGNSEGSVLTPTSGRLLPRTRGNGARRRNKGRNVS